MLINFKTLVSFLGYSLFVRGSGNIWNHDPNLKFTKSFLFIVRSLPCNSQISDHNYKVFTGGNVALAVVMLFTVLLLKEIRIHCQHAIRRIRNQKGLKAETPDPNIIPLPRGKGSFMFYNSFYLLMRLMCVSNNSCNMIRSFVLWAGNFSVYLFILNCFLWFVV